MNIQMLTENWNETKDALLEGLGEKRAAVSQVLENTKKEILMAETASAGVMGAHNIANFRKTLLPLIRRVIPGTIASEIVGVQAMSGPVDQIYSLRYQYDEDVTHDPARSAFGGYDVASGDEMFGNDNPLRQFYSSSNGQAQASGVSGMGPAGLTLGEIDTSVNEAEGDAWGSASPATTYGTGTMDFNAYSYNVGGSLLGGSGSYLEGSGGRKMSFKIVSQAVEAGSRKMQAGWTIEAMQDANSQHNVDIETEVTKAMSAEIVQEIDAEIINDLLALAGTVRTFDFTQSGGTTYAPAFVGDRFANLGVRINEVADVIGRKTRRGSGNFIVVSPMVVSILRSAGKAVFAPAVEGSFKSPTNTELVGTLNGSIKVYSYLWNVETPGSTAPDGEGKILVGYKGGNGETDAGYFYAPYIPLMSSGVMVDPYTTEPRISLMTRYGKVAFTDPTTSLGNSADYYGKINLSHVDFI
jgi:hypothetical protein